MFRTILFGLFLAGTLAAFPAMAGNDGKKDVIIRQGKDTLIIRTDPSVARRIQKMLDKGNGRVVIKNRNFTYYPDNYYPYYRNRDNPYSFGYMLGKEID